MTAANPAKLLTPENVADVLGITLHTLAVWRCVNRVALPYVKVGARVRYRPNDLETFITSRTLGVAAAE